jgi:hypothetical protein
MQFLQTSTYQARFVAPIQQRQKIVRDRFFWHEIPSNLDLKSLPSLAKTIGHSNSLDSKTVVELSRTTVGEIFPIHEVRKLWILEKIARQVVLAIGIELKLDILSLDQLIGDESGDCTKFVLFSFRDGVDVLPAKLINLPSHLVSVGFTSDTIWTYKKGNSHLSIPAKPSHLPVFVGAALVPDEDVKFGWSYSKGSIQNGLQKAGVLVTLSKLA